MIISNFNLLLVIVFTNLKNVVLRNFTGSIIIRSYKTRIILVSIFKIGLDTAEKEPSEVSYWIGREA